MKTIDATLTTAQKTGGGSAVARVLMADNGKLHPVQLFNNAPTGSNSDAVNTGSEFVRLRHIAGGTNRLDVQRITTPETQSQWTTWASLVAADVYSIICIFWTGTYVVAVWQDVSTKEIKYKRSADGGITFGATAVAYASPGVFLTAIHGVSGGSAQSGLMLAYTGQLYWASYNPGADTWAALNSAALTATGITSVAAAYDSANTRHVVALIPFGYVVWCTAPIVILTRSTAGVWSAGRVYFGVGGDTSSQGNLSMSQGKIGSYFWLAFTRIKNYGASVEKYWLACSNDGVFWEDAFAVDVEAEARLVPLGSLASLNWLANERRVFNSNTHGLDAERFDLFYYLLRHGANTGEILADATNLLNEFTADEPTSYMIVRPERGYIVAGITYIVQAGTFYLVGHRFLKADKVCRLMAVDALGLLDAWEADQTFRYDGETLKALVELVCAIGGVHTVSFDAAAVWTDTIGIFTLNPGISGLAALRSIAQRANAECVVLEDGSISFFVPTASPASTYTYGNDAGNHNHWVGEFGRGIAPNFEAVFGVYDTSIGQQIGEDVADYTAQAEAGRKFADITNERRILVTADATELANARLVLAKEFKRVGECETPPNLALEPMDVVAFSASVSAFANTAGGWRVEAFTEEFGGPRRDRRYFQHLTLRGVA